MASQPIAELLATETADCVSFSGFPEKFLPTRLI
jgi:hypothetical protein